MTLRLPVTSIERYHLADDSRENPNVISCELTIRGDFNRDIATAAIREVATRHPMICARLQNGKWRRSYWDLSPSHIDSLVVRSLDEDSTSDSPQSIDPANGLPTSFLMRRIDDERTRLSFRTHHAAMDGGGGLQIVADWLLTYHRISTCKDKPGSRATNPDLLLRRNHLRLLSREFISKLWIQPVAMMGAVRFLFRKVQSVLTGEHGGDGSVSQSADSDFQFVSHRLSKEEATWLRDETARNKVTINDRVLQAVFLGIHDFRKQRSHFRQGEWLRLIVPINIRDFADRRMPAANRATIVQIDRTDVDFADPAGLTRGVNSELGNIRSWNLEKTFLMLVRCFSCIPGIVSGIARKDICRATSVVTNLGAPFERLKLDRIDGMLCAGNLMVENVDLIVPLRRHTPVGFAVLRYRGLQTISMHFDPCQIDEGSAREILDLVILRLLRREPNDAATDTS